MREKRMYRRIFSVVLVFTLVMSSVGVFAEGFTDIASNFWGKSVIDKAVNAGLMKGYSDGSFKPNQQVSKIEAVAMISRLIENKKDNIENDYNELLDKLKVAEEYRADIAAALAFGIITEEELGRIYYEDSHTKPMEKAEVCRYLTRAMGLEAEARAKTSMFLPFKDAELISPNLAFYVSTMIDKGVISQRGDEEGKFNPSMAMNRVMMATVLTKSYDYIKDNNIKLESGVAPVDNDTITIEGTITAIMAGSNDVVLLIEDSRNRKNFYKIDNNTDIRLDGLKINPSGLSTGLVVTARVNKENIITSITGNSIEERYQGKLTNLTIGSNPKVTVEYIEDGKTKTKALNISDDIVVTLDGNEAFLYHVKQEDLIDAYVKNGRIVKLIAESKNKFFKGTVKDFTYGALPTMILVGENNVLTEHHIDSKTLINRNGKKVEFTDLRRGDLIEVETVYNVTSKITAKSTKTEDEGTITAITISRKPEITIVNEDGQQSTYYISKDSIIRIDKQVKTIYDLRLDYYVALKIESNEVISMDVYARDQNTRYEGVVQYVNEKANVITIRTKDNQSVRIDVTNETKYMTTDLKVQYLKDLKVGDNLIISGSYDGGIFMAKSVIITR